MRKEMSSFIVTVLLSSAAFAQAPTADTTHRDSIENFRKQDLREVKVVGRRKLIEQKIDRTVVNVDASATNAGTSALEVLEKSPGVQVDKDGNISLKGKQGVTVLIDGRPTYLSASQLATMLRGMESSQLDQIEIMTNPPARYDAAGNSGVINIKTKKNKVKGFNGNASASYGQGKYAKTDESLSLNYRAGKVNIFSNYSYGDFKGFRRLDIHRRYIDDAKATRAVFDQNSGGKQHWQNENLKAGIDYFVNKKTTLGFVFTGFSNAGSETGFNTSYLKNAFEVTDSIVQSNSATKERWKNGGLNLNMRHTYDSLGRELDIDVDAIGYNVTNHQRFSNAAYTSDMQQRSEDELLGDLPMKINIYSAKADYTRPLKNKAKLETGWKSSYVVTDSKAKYFTVDGETTTPDYTKTNFFRYRENINAAYVTYSRPLSAKLTAQAGLRFENTNYAGTQSGNPTRRDSSFRSSYNGLFPTGYVSYAANKNNTFGASVGRRIDRPQYQDLNPFLFFIDRYTYGSGNPYLRPQYSTNVELTHVYKGMITTTLNYSYTRNMFTETFDQLGDYTTVQSNGNLGHRTNMGVAVSAQFQPAKWFSTNIYTNYSYTRLDGTLFGDPVRVSAGTFNGNINNQFNFNKGWGVELSGWYNSKGIEGQLVLQSMGAINAGISKQVMKGSGTLKLTARDIFYTQPVGGHIYFKTTQATFSQGWDSRVVTASFIYRFGKPLNTPQRRERSNEEQNRVKGAH